MSILSYGDDIEVVQPTSLRAGVIEAIGAMQAVYETDRG
jgi:predicted DNA-binding transcriptional regulator YafY